VRTSDSCGKPGNGDYPCSRTTGPSTRRIDAISTVPAITWTAAVINFNGGDAVSHTIASLKELRDPPDEIILVDDGSTDTSLATVRTRHPNVRIVPMPDHSGRPAAVRNRALRNARHRYVLLCDNDLQLAADAMTHLISTMRSAPDIAVCSGVVVSDDNPALIEVRARPLHFLCWTTALQERTLAEARAKGAQLGIGCGIQLVDREAAATASFFAENLALGWMDDGDLHHRLLLFGYRCLSVPGAVVTHHRVRKVSRTYGQIHNRWFLLLSHYQLRTLIMLAPALVVFELLLIAHMTLSGEVGNYVRALRDVIAELPQIRTLRQTVQQQRRLRDKQVLSALDLDLPRHLRDRRPLVAAVRWLSAGFRCYWLIAARFL
jgi:GT2 family glycosyltransferase